MSRYVKLILVFFFATSTVFALDSLPVNRSVVWQGQLLEQQVTGKIHSALNSILEKDQFIIDVKIEMRTPDVKSKEDDDGQNSGGGGGGAGNEDKNEEKSKPKVRFTDTLPEKEPGEYILFAKLGIEAPLIDDFIAPDKKSEKSEQGPSASPQKKKSFEEQLIADQKFDIFNNLESIFVTVYISEEISPEIRKQVKLVLDSINFNFGTIVPQLAVKYVKMGEEVVETFDVFSFMREFAIPLTIFASVIIFGLILLSIAKMVGKQENQQAQGPSISIKNELPERESDSGTMSPALAAIGGANDHDAAGRMDGIERFINYYEKTPGDAILLIRKWIKTGTSQSQDALRALVQEVDNHILSGIFVRLEVEDRESWRRSLDKVLKDAQLSESKRFIGTQVVEEIMSAGGIDDTELCELLLEISPKQAIHLMKTDVDMSKLLMNVSPPVFVNSVISELELDDLREVANHAKEFDIDGMRDRFDSIKQSLKSQVKGRKITPFIRQLVKLYPDCDPDKEFALLEAISEATDGEFFMNILLEKCPYSAISSLPELFLKNVLEQFELKDKVPFLLSIPNNERDHYISIAASTGTRARDLIDLEISTKSNDKIFMADVTNNSSAYKKRFLDIVRRSFAADPNTFIENDLALRDWVGKSFESIKSFDRTDIGIQARVN